MDNRGGAAMKIWQIEAAKEFKAFLNNFLEVKEIELAGSILEPDLLDVFSDVDVKVFLPDSNSLDLSSLLNALTERFFSVFGYEFFRNDNNDVLRLCLENGWRFDLTFIYPEQREPDIENNSFTDKVESVISKFWFTAVMVLVKLGRKDNLVASHLVLELCQLIIVIQMIIRDNEKDTEMHRYGNSEDVPVLHKLAGSSKSKCEDVVLFILYQAAELMDKVSSALGKHHSRTEKLREIQSCFIYQK